MGMNLFGTDGIRGEANTELSPELAFAVGRALVGVLVGEGHKDIWGLIGRDTRVSGTMLQAAFEAGMMSAGGNVLRTGVIPTPAVAYLTRVTDVNFGVMISASHNPVGDNGLKIFDSNGVKLEDQREMAISEAVAQVWKHDKLPRPTSLEVGQSVRNTDAINLYLEQISKLPVSLRGLKIVCDGAHGAAAPYIYDLFYDLGAEVLVINAQPDGARINVSCGATDTRRLQQVVVEEGADLGLAFDGDADRVMAVDHKGQLVNGDSILYVWGKYLHQKKVLAPCVVVGTVMSNMGLEVALRHEGIELERTKVGDRYVWQRMHADNLVLGGEQSGHIINRLLGTTGDGMLTGLHLAAIVKETGMPLAKLCQALKFFPQILLNVRVKDKGAVMDNHIVNSAIAQAQKAMGKGGRILVRPSGTEAKVRVMVEAQDELVANTWAQKVAGVIEAQSK